MANWDTERYGHRPLAPRCSTPTCAMWPSPLTGATSPSSPPAPTAQGPCATPPPGGIQCHGTAPPADLGGLHRRRHALQRGHHRHRDLRRRSPSLVEQPLRRRPGRPRSGRTRTDLRTRPRHRACRSRGTRAGPAASACSSSTQPSRASGWEATPTASLGRHTASWLSSRSPVAPWFRRTSRSGSPTTCTTCRSSPARHPTPRSSTGSTVADPPCSRSTADPTGSATTLRVPSTATPATAPAGATGVTLPGEFPATTPSQVFQSERWDDGGSPEMEWDFPVAGGYPRRGAALLRQPVRRDRQRGWPCLRRLRRGRQGARQLRHRGRHRWHPRARREAVHHHERRDHQHPVRARSGEPADQRHRDRAHRPAAGPPAGRHRLPRTPVVQQRRSSDIEHRLHSRFRLGRGEGRLRQQRRPLRGTPGRTDVRPQLRRPDRRPGCRGGPARGQHAQLQRVEHHRDVLRRDAPLLHGGR